MTNYHMDFFLISDPLSALGTDISAREPILLENDTGYWEN